MMEMLPNHNPNLYWVSLAFDIEKIKGIRDNAQELLELQRLRSKITQEGIRSEAFNVQPIIGWRELLAGKLSPVLAYGVVPYESTPAWIYDAHFGRVMGRDGTVKTFSSWMSVDVLEPVNQLISKSFGLTV